MNRKFILYIRILFFIGFLFSSYFAHSQMDEKKALRRAERYFLVENYPLASDYYMMLADSFPDNFNYQYETALLFFYEMDNKPKSISYFERAKKCMKKDSIPQLYLYLGQAYQSKGDYNNAIDAFKYYQQIDSNFIKVSVTRYIRACELGLNLESKSKGNTKVENLGPAINTKFSEYTSVFLREDSILLFTSRRSKNIYDEMIEAIYAAEYKNGLYINPTKIDSLPEYKDLVMDVNEFQSIVSTNASNDQLILYYDPNLYVSYFEGGKWGKPKLLPPNINFNFVTTHASVTADGNDIYFSCYSRKTPGNLDIYHATKQNDGSWGPATRLPSIINTRRKEDSPEISLDGKTLYFASDGLPGMGGFDIFKSDLVDGEWSKPENLGAPINSPSHDIYFHLHRGVEGTLSSNRDGGYGGMDIYRVFFPEELSQTAFNDCKPGRYGSYKVIFDATKSIDPFGSKVYYEWEFGDNTIARGNKVTHYYKMPGTYKAFLNVVDSITGMVEKHEKEFNIEIKDVDYLNFDCDTTLKAKELITLNAEKFNIKGATLEDYYWQVEPDSIKQGNVIQYKFDKPGEFEVKLKVLFTIENLEREQCFSRIITVLPN